MKHKLMNSFIAFVVFVAFVAIVAPSAHADMCTTQYGGTTECKPSDLTINKQVYNPDSKVFVENLTTTDHTFGATNEVLFKLTIKNGSGETFNPVKVKDILPPYLTFVAGPGSYNKDTNTLEFELKELIAGETRTVEILTKVVESGKFPAGKSLFCVTNVSEVSALNRFDSDSAQACMQEGEKVTTLPVAGFDNLMVLLPFLGVGLGGVALLKKRT